MPEQIVSITFNFFHYLIKHYLQIAEGSVVRNTYLGHQQWVQTVMWSTTEEYLFVSGSYDNQNKLWDCRRFVLLLLYVLNI